MAARAPATKSGARKHDLLKLSNAPPKWAAQSAPFIYRFLLPTGRPTIESRTRKESDAIVCHERVPSRYAFRAGDAILSASGHIAARGSRALREAAALRMQMRRSRSPSPRHAEHSTRRLMGRRVGCSQCCQRSAVVSSQIFIEKFPRCS